MHQGLGGDHLGALPPELIASLLAGQVVQGREVSSSFQIVTREAIVFGALHLSSALRKQTQQAYDRALDRQPFGGLQRFDKARRGADRDAIGFPRRDSAT